MISDAEFSQTPNSALKIVMNYGDYYTFYTAMEHKVYSKYLVKILTISKKYFV